MIIEWVVGGPGLAFETWVFRPRHTAKRNTAKIAEDDRVAVEAHRSGVTKMRQNEGHGTFQALLP